MGKREMIREIIVLSFKRKKNPNGHLSQGAVENSHHIYDKVVFRMNSLQSPIDRFVRDSEGRRVVDLDTISSSDLNLFV